MKDYNVPEIELEVVELEDIMAESFGGSQPGDVESPFGWENN